MSSRFVGLCLSVGYQRPLLTHCWSLEADISRLLCARSVVLSKHNGGLCIWLVWHHTLPDAQFGGIVIRITEMLPYYHTPCVPSVVDKGITCSLILYFLLHSKTCKYDWSNMSQFVRAHFIQMHVCVFVICYIKNVVKYDFIYTVTENLNVGFCGLIQVYLASILSASAVYI